jgi:hypothetical protein
MFQPGYLPSQVLAGKLFIGSTTYAGVAIPAYNATAQVFGLWNPAGSGVNLVLVKLNLAIATLGTNIVAALGLSYLANAGNATATAAPISAFTQTASLSGLIGAYGGGAAPSLGRFTLSATITAPTFFYDLGMTSTTGTPTDSNPVLTHDFDGTVIVTPGTYIGLGGSVAPGSTYQGSLSWIELPVSGS